MKVFIFILLGLAAVGGGIWYFFFRPTNAAPSYRFAKIEKGDLWVTVTATGTVQPVTQVQVGTQVTGTIQKLNADFNSRVTAGQVIAQIDPAPFQARVEQDKANLAKAEADVERVKAQLNQAEKELARSRELAKRELISPSELDAAQANYDALVAQLKVSTATVAQSNATLEISQVNLNYTTIVSPVDGVVISRNVDVGQTVSASLSAPTLFVIAANLKSIQIQASVSEADIGRISEDQRASFTVDAYRDMRFRGKVSQVRLAPTTVQNVVTYTVMINAENPEEKLLPGMTASISFEVEHQKEVLKVPNSALRFMPPNEPLPETPAPGQRMWERGQKQTAKGHVWIQSNAGLKMVQVVPGSTDGAFTQIVQGEVQEGQEVAVGLAQDAGNAPVNNPFAPRFGGGGRGR
jgi:HlyD family secretion protein